MDKLNSTNYADFGNIQDRFGQFFGPKNDSHYLDIKFKDFMKD